MGFYGLAYVLYIAMEFSFFESILHEIEQRNLFGKFTFKKKKHPEDIEEKERHSFLSIACAALLAGSSAAFLTNFFESLAVNKQHDPNIDIGKMLKKKGMIWSLFRNGIWYRSAYYGVQAALMFMMFEEFANVLKVDILEFD